VISSVSSASQPSGTDCGLPTNETLRSLLHLRHQLRHAPRVLAPLSLLVDDASLRHTAPDAASN
jgi:hypothetical protein